MKKPLVKEGTKCLSIVSGSRCGAAGLKMIGRHFTPGQPTVIGLDEIDRRTLRGLLVHGDLVVTQHADKPATAPAAKPAPAAAASSGEDEPSKPKKKKNE
jgi:hypothetical protein